MLLSDHWNLTLEYSRRFSIHGDSYTSTFRRIKKIKVPEITHEYTFVALDSTGFKTTIRGDWLSNKWAKKSKGWIKLHVSSDTDKIMASRMSITSEKSHHAT